MNAHNPQRPPNNLLDILVYLVIQSIVFVFDLIVWLIGKVYYFTYFRFTFTGKIGRALTRVETAFESFNQFGQALRERVKEIESAVDDIAYMREDIYLLAEKSLLKFTILTRINALNLKILARKKEELLSLEKEKKLLDVIRSTQRFVNDRFYTSLNRKKMVDELDYLIGYDFETEISDLIRSVDHELDAQSLRQNLEYSCGFRALSEITFYEDDLPQWEQELGFDIDEIILDIEKFEALDSFSDDFEKSLV